MNYNFFADRADKIKLLNLIFDETDLRLFDCYSGYGEPVSEYKTANEVSQRFDLEYGGQSAVTFHLWSPQFSSDILIEKIDLDPKHCKGIFFAISQPDLA